MNHHETVIHLLKTHFGDKEISGIEIGTGGGALPAAIMLLCPNVFSLITIDPYKHKDKVEFEAGWPQERLDATKAEAVRRLSVHKDRISMLHIESDAAFDILKGHYDFIWIDGNHIGEQVIKDLRFEKFVKPGGFIGGHDFGQVHPLTEIIKEKYGDKLNTGGDFSWWVFV
jgi:hypothetical protein